MRRRRVMLWGWAGALILAAVLAGRTARAENLGPGGGTRVIVGDQLVGPYRLFITSSPEPTQVGMVTFVVRITDPATGEKVRDAEVTVTLTLAGSDQILVQPATHGDAGNPVDYAAHVTIEQPGSWAGVIRISGSAGSVEVPFVQRVLSPRGGSTLLLVSLPFLIVLAVLGGVWYARAVARPQHAG